MNSSVFSLSQSSLLVRDLLEKEMVVRSEAREGAETAPPPALLEKLKNYEQDHAFSLWDQLSAEERDLLVKDIESLDLPRIDRIIKCSLELKGLPMPSLEPVLEACVSIVKGRTPYERERLWKKGLRAISEGKLAVVLFSGGRVCYLMRACVTYF
ncbi:putative nucleotidyltransferase [Dioscorea sansibarensis]